jgi:hypothetical protein
MYSMSRSRRSLAHIPSTLKALDKYPYLNGKWEWVVKNTQSYFSAGGSYSFSASGNLGVRVLPAGRIFHELGPFVVLDPDKDIAALAVLNARLYAMLLRTLADKLRLRADYVNELPAIPESLLQHQELQRAASVCIEHARRLTEKEPTEYEFKDLAYQTDTFSAVTMADDTFRLNIEGFIEATVCREFRLSETDVEFITRQLGMPAAWYPPVSGYDESLSRSQAPAILEMRDGSTPISSGRPSSLSNVRMILRALCMSGPGTAIDDVTEDLDLNFAEGDEDDGVDKMGSGTLPAELFLEELSQKLQIHPISVYWILEEMRREEGLVCPPELRRYTEEYLSVKLLRMLGHRWPMQDQYEQEEGRAFLDPRWVDEDGIIPLTAGSGEERPVERFRRFLDDEFGHDRGHETEREIEHTLGWKSGTEWGAQRPLPLERWFEREFFSRHVSQFKRRPIAWHLTSPKGTFQVIVYYHKFDRNRLQLLRSRYVRDAVEGLRRRLGEARAAGDDRQALARTAEMEAQLADVQEFDARLGRLLEGKEREARIWCPWKSEEEQPVGWNPDINDGVRVNVAPVQRLGLLAGEVLSKKDLKSLLAPEGRG